MTSDRSDVPHISDMQYNIRPYNPAVEQTPPPREYKRQHKQNKKARKSRIKRRRNNGLIQDPTI